MIKERNPCMINPQLQQDKAIVQCPRNPNKENINIEKGSQPQIHNPIVKPSLPLPFLRKQGKSNMCFHLRKIYDCQHCQDSTKRCYQHVNRHWKSSPRDCPRFYIVRILRSINLCAACRSRVQGYLFINERLQEYREHWGFVNWVGGSGVEVMEELLPGVL
jgi:hypothetical protein